MASFFSRTPGGKLIPGYPVGDHPKFRGFQLEEPDRVIVQLHKLFVIFKDVTHETGMVAVRKQAGFTITATRDVGVTMNDVCNQTRKILGVMRANPDVYDMRDSNCDDWQILDSMHYVTPGHFEMFIAPIYGDPETWDFENECRMNGATPSKEITSGDLGEDDF